jgi:dTDP-4-amino-4,6-dideoxygalactose transaminase
MRGLAQSTQDGLAPRSIQDSYSHRHDEDALHFERALATGLTGTSDIVAEYERALAAHFGAPHVVAVSSGSAAVMAALRAFDWVAGQEVIVPPTAPICTVLPLLEAGLTPVFCDVAPASFGFDQVNLESLIGPRTCAVIEVPMWGYPIAADATRALTMRRGIPLIMDLAHAYQTHLHGKLLSAYGDVSCFSTHDGKYISTGEGGSVATCDAGLAERVRAYTRFGNLDGHTFGVNLKLSGLQAALGLARVPALDRDRFIRLQHREALLSMLDNPYFREMPIIPGGEPSGYALVLQAMDHDGRELVRYQVAHGIPSDVDKYDNQPLYLYPLLASRARHCPNATHLLRSLTTVPLHPELSVEDLEYIAHALNAYRPEGVRR